MQNDSPSRLLHLSTAQYLLGYSLLGAATVACNCSRNATSIWGSVRAASRLHAALLAKVLGLPMAFFDSQPLGRLLNRFTKVTCILWCQPTGACSTCSTKVSRGLLLPESSSLLMKGRIDWMSSQCASPK